MGNNEFESAKILGAKLRRKSLTKFVEKQEIQIKNQATEISLANQALQDMLIDSKQGSSDDSLDHEDNKMEKRDNVDDNGFSTNFYKEFQKVNERMRKSSQGGYGQSIFLDARQKTRKRSQSLGRKGLIDSPSQIHVIQEERSFSRRNSTDRIQTLN